MQKEIQAKEKADEARRLASLNVKSTTGASPQAGNLGEE
jgi:hypothetical protein